MKSECECCKNVFEVNNYMELEWKQYCILCFANKGNNEYDIVVAGINSKGYEYYKCIPSPKIDLTKFAFIDDDDE